MYYSVFEDVMTPFGFQAAQKTSASLRSSVWQFENVNNIIPCSITEQCTPSHFYNFIKELVWRRPNAFQT